MSTSDVHSMNNVVAKAVSQSKHGAAADSSPHESEERPKAPAKSHSHLHWRPADLSHQDSHKSARKAGSGSSKQSQHPFTSGSLREEDEEEGEPNRPGRNGSEFPFATQPFKGVFSAEDTQRGQKLLEESTTPAASRSNSIRGADVNRSPAQNGKKGSGSSDRLNTRPSAGRRSTSAAFFFSRLTAPGAVNSTTPEALDVHDSHRAPNESDLNVVSESPQTHSPVDEFPSHSLPAGDPVGESPSQPSQAGPIRNSSGRPGLTAKDRGWTALRNRIRTAPGDKGVTELSKTLSGHELISELTVGLLPVIMLKMSLTDRDEHDQHRIPVRAYCIQSSLTAEVSPLDTLELSQVCSCLYQRPIC